MGRSRSWSYSPTRRDRSRSPFRRSRRRDDDVGARRKSWRGRELGGRFSTAPTSLLVRNIARDSRPEDVRIPFERFGPVKDVYLPKDYYSGEPRGFGFVQYLDPADAADAQYHMDRQFIDGREITVVFAEENRKKPSEMRVKERSSTPTGRGIHSAGRGGGFGSDKYRKRSPGHRFRSLSRSCSPPARRHTSRDQPTARDKRSKHGPPGSSAKKSSSPEANGQGARKSWSRSFSPLARSSASKSDSLE
ncbi:hypothetical protein KC19_5G154700 [Ceratodon purpureus]|nr:hypothetical protein KC19_5G154700 [Ceratodon purpureus]KAG0577418.1 hypothetical protein KC19_5G154700 [Ceratodon purpureus]KAG0577423.1 hypothetical protein KC19_5G154700 [Ceratodon purpureus]KAG0577424.1 hypothetical protein KC19_5G154700 [Ceratodon purpureus]